MSDLRKIVTYLDRTLSIGDITDYPNALNGLQVENSGRVSRIAAAVDGCEFTIRSAANAGAGLLLVHHGLFWSGAQPVTGANFRRLKTAMDAGLAVYSAHLPLDLHSTLGNNALLSRQLGLGKTQPFFEAFGRPIGLRAQVRLDRKTLVSRLEKAVNGPVTVCPGGPARVRNVGVVTGGAGGEIAKAAAEGVDTFITGEAPHHAFTAAEELGVNLLLGGHYATETFGVKALAAKLATRFKLPWLFIDHPTGL